MDKLNAQTLQSLCSQLAAHPWETEELNELVDPKLGIFTGFQELLEELEVLRQIDLEFTAPAQGVQRKNRL